MTTRGTSNVAPIVTSQRYLLHAYSTSAKIVLRTVKESMPSESIERYSSDCMIWDVARSLKIFLFRFGAVVFFNIAPELHQSYLAQLGIAAKLHNPNPDMDELAEDNFALQIEQDITKVQFNMVTIPEWDMAKLQLVAQLLAQSSALEIIEWEVEEFMARSEEMTSNLKKNARIRHRRHELLRFLGDGLTTRHRIVNQLSLLNDPEKTWEREELYTIFIGLWDNFDLDERMHAIEKNLQLCTEVTELLIEMLNSRRIEIMELIVIGLIAIEIVKPLVF